MARIYLIKLYFIMHIPFSILCLPLLIFILGACQPQKEFTFPAHFPPPIIPDRNPMTEPGINLGKRLFFDTNLSNSGRISCASCHLPSHSFADSIPLSLGDKGLILDRHTPTLINLAWMPELFWDGGAKNLESSIFAPLTHTKEMNMSLHQITSRLNQGVSYLKQFKATFGTDSVYSAYIARALAQYLRTLIAANSPFDQYFLTKDSTFLSTKAFQGYLLFQKHCQACHPPPLFTDNQYHNIGLNKTFPPNNEGIYQGRFRISLDSTDIGKFKTPTLRNIARTAPYMHDGRFTTLEEVLQHYSHQVQSSATLDPFFFQNKTNSPRIELSPSEQEAIIAFLNTLTEQ